MGDQGAIPRSSAEEARSVNAPPHERSVWGYLPGAMLPISLLTDFGLTDTYVGQMKAALLQVAPTAVLVDLTHAVPAQDVKAGAFLLWSAVEAFARGLAAPGGGGPGRGLDATRRGGDGPDGETCWWGRTTDCWCRRSSSSGGWPRRSS